MKTIKKMLTATLLLSASGTVFANSCGEILGHSLPQLRKKETLDLCETYKGKTLLIVNTASKCGFTPLYDISVTSATFPLIMFTPSSNNLL